MTSQQLPDQPNLEQLKKQAKSLLHGARANDRIELERFRSLPALSSKSVEELGAIASADWVFSPIVVTRGALPGADGSPVATQISCQ